MTDDDGSATWETPDPGVTGGKPEAPEGTDTRYESGDPGNAPHGNQVWGEEDLSEAGIIALQHMFDLARERRLIVETGDIHALEAQTVVVVEFMRSLSADIFPVMISQLVLALEDISTRLRAAGARVDFLAVIQDHF